jgi:HTH-type transcriptional regulator/antitoxin HigA
MQRHNFESFDALHATLPTADKVWDLIVFNIGGNNYWLITSIHFNRGKVYICHALTHRECDRAVTRLNVLLDEIGTNERHPLYTLLDTLGTVIHAYEEQHHPMPACSGAEMLRFFMEEHGLTQSDLPEIGTQGVVSEILHGKRELDIRQILALASGFTYRLQCSYKPAFRRGPTRVPGGELLASQGTTLGSQASVEGEEGVSRRPRGKLPPFPQR